MANIIPLSEGTFTIGHDKIFYPFDPSKDELNSRPVGSLLVEVQPFLIINDKDILLLDTGLGFKNDQGISNLEENLRKHNITPDQITKVLLSHLHKDHAGAVWPELFINATFYIYSPEMEFAESTGMPSYYIEELKMLHHAKNVVWLEGLAGQIDDYIHYEHTGAHSPQHIVFHIEDKDGLIFFGGDEAPQYKQMIMKYIAKYDFDGEKAMRLRKEWADLGGREHWKFLFYHDIKTPVNTI